MCVCVCMGACVCACVCVCVCGLTDHDVISYDSYDMSSYDRNVILSRLIFPWLFATSMRNPSQGIHKCSHRQPVSFRRACMSFAVQIPRSYDNLSNSSSALSMCCHRVGLPGCARVPVAPDQNKIALWPLMTTVKCRDIDEPVSLQRKLS